MKNKGGCSDVQWWDGRIWLYFYVDLFRSNSILFYLFASIAKSLEKIAEKIDKIEPKS